METQERVVENNNTFVQNNAEIFVANTRPSAENTDNFFTVLNRFADLLNNPRPVKPSFLPIPTDRESATLEAVNNPVSFTPYVKEIFFMDSSLATIHSTLQSIHDHAYLAKVELWKPRSNFKNTNQIDQIAQSSHQGGANFNGYSNNPGGNKESLQVAKPPTVTLSNQIPNFPNSSANYFANESIIREANDSERFDSPFICTCDRCSGRINFDNQIHCGNGRISKNIEDISGEARNKRSFLEQESPGILSLYQPIHDLQSILSCDHH